MLPNISRCKDNQTIKFGQLIEYNMRNVFLEKSYTKSFFFFYRYIIAHTFKNIKTLSPGTNILGVPGKNKKKFLIKKLTKTN